MGELGWLPAPGHRLLNHPPGGVCESSSELSKWLRVGTVYLFLLLFKGSNTILEPLPRGEAKAISVVCSTSTTAEQTFFLLSDLLLG